MATTSNIGNVTFVGGADTVLTPGGYIPTGYNGSASYYFFHWRGVDLVAANPYGGEDLAAGQVWGTAAGGLSGNLDESQVLMRCLDAAQPVVWVLYQPLTLTAPITRVQLHLRARKMNPLIADNDRVGNPGLITASVWTNIGSESQEAVGAWGSIVIDSDDYVDQYIDITVIPGHSWNELLTPSTDEWDMGIESEWGEIRPFYPQLTVASGMSLLINYTNAFEPETTGPVEITTAELLFYSSTLSVGPRSDNSGFYMHR